MQDAFREDLAHWVSTDVKLAQRLLKIVDETLRDPFHGIGKPEALVHAPGLWSRRLTEEHRIVYRVSREHVDFLQARFHYKVR
jgi:toxin YoeB